MMEIRLDQDDKAPPYEQIKAQIIGLIGRGALAVGFRLPSIRQLAGDLGVAPNTVARAYRELEADGFVRSRGRRGTVVVNLADAHVTDGPADAIVRAVDDARRRGLDGATILDLTVRAIART
jgi:DNA-binding transcriptional regulator YhcF (GntR family)